MPSFRKGSLRKRIVLLVNFVGMPRQLVARAVFAGRLACLTLVLAGLSTGARAQIPGAAIAPPTAGQVNRGQTGSTTNNTQQQQNNSSAAQADAAARRARGEATDAERRDRSANGTQEVPTEFQRLVADSTGVSLPIFGESLFYDPLSYVAPEGVPVSNDYVIGPGDELRIQVFGAVNEQDNATVDRNGNITLKDVGDVHVAGVRYSQLQTFLKSQLGRVFRNFDLNVNLGQLRSIQIFVTGSARRQGTFTVSSLSTLLNALFASGGPLPQGSLRNIELLRNNEVVTHFDLYDLLLHGDKSHDVSLEPGDVIFIPPVGAQVAITGSVNNPAIYEIKPGTTVKQLIR